MNPFTEKTIRSYLKVRKQLLITEDFNGIHTVHRFEDAEEAIAALKKMKGQKTIYFNR